MPGRDHQLGIGVSQSRQQRQVPQVVAVVIAASLGREQLERRELHAVQTIGRPAVAAVGGRERVGVASSRASALEQRADVDAVVESLLQHPNGNGQRGAGGCPDCGVLRAQQFLGLRTPRQQLGVEQQPAGLEFIPQAGRRDSSAQPLQQAVVSAALKNGRPVRV